MVSNAFGTMAGVPHFAADRHYSIARPGDDGLGHPTCIRVRCGRRWVLPGTIFEARYYDILRLFETDCDDLPIGIFRRKMLDTGGLQAKRSGF